MKYTKKQNFIIPVDLFDADITVAINMTEKEIIKVFHKEKKPRIDEVSDSIKDWDKNEMQGGVVILSFSFLILLRISGNIKKDIGVIAHEISHASMRIFKYNMVELSDKTEEIFCLLVGCLTDKIIKKAYNGRRTKHR